MQCWFDQSATTKVLINVFCLGSQTKVEFLAPIFQFIKVFTSSASALGYQTAASFPLLPALPGRPKCSQN